MSTLGSKYAYRVMWSEETKEHVGLCTEFPSLSWLSETQGEALLGITQLVAHVLVDMAKREEPVPEPYSLRPFKGNILLRIPPEQHRELAIEAAEQGVSLNQFSQKLGWCSQ
jgi:predicted HicB family RNase H-like nuclease